MYASKSQNERYFFKYDDIKPGDTIEIYFDENRFESDKRTNMSVRYIDKNGKNIFFLKPNDQIAGICFIYAGIGLLSWLIILKQKGKIV
jgi:hypothetical protein